MIKKIKLDRGDKRCIGCVSILVCFIAISTFLSMSDPVQNIIGTPAFHKEIQENLCGGPPNETIIIKQYIKQ